MQEITVTVIDDVIRAIDGYGKTALLQIDKLRPPVENKSRSVPFSLSNSDTYINFRFCNGRCMGKKHSCNSSNQPDIFFHSHSPVNILFKSDGTINPLSLQEASSLLSHQ